MIAAVPLAYLALAWWLAAMGLLLGSAALAALPMRRAPARPSPEPVSVVIPLHADHPDLPAATLSALAAPAGSEILLSATDLGLPAVLAAQAALVERGMAPRLVPTRRAAAANPKVANLIAPVSAARHDLLLTKDALSTLPPGLLARMAAALAEPGVGLVSAVPIGRSPDTFAAAVEAALVNTHGARLLLAAARLGQGFGIGAAMLMRRSELDRAGGLAGADAVADDAALARLYRGAGLRTVAAGMVDQPLGRRAFGDVIRRHRRWALCRRLEAPAVFWGEPFGGLLGAGLAATLAAPLFGGSALVSVPATALAWVGAETALAAHRGWPLGWRTPLAILAREALAPTLWLAALATRRLAWGGAVLPARRGRLPAAP